MDPKPEKRIKDYQASSRKLMSDPRCRACEEKPATDGHHILLRSQGGDDVPDNIMPLCHQCHMDWHAGNLSNLTVKGQESIYVMGKLGRVAGMDYLKRRHYVLKGY